MPAPLASDAPAHASDGARIAYAKKRAAGAGPATTTLRPQPSASAQSSPRGPVAAAALAVLGAAAGAPSDAPPPPEAVTKPDVDELLAAGFELGEGRSAYGGKSYGAGSKSREIAESKARIEGLFDLYEGYEDEGEAGEPIDAACADARLAMLPRPPPPPVASEAVGAPTGRLGPASPPRRTTRARWGL